MSGDQSTIIQKSATPLLFACSASYLFVFEDYVLAHFHALLIYGSQFGPCFIRTIFIRILFLLAAFFFDDFFLLAGMQDIGVDCPLGGVVDLLHK